METVVSTVSSILTMFGTVFTFITGQPLLLVMCVLPIVGGIIYLITSIFRK